LQVKFRGPRAILSTRATLLCARLCCIPGHVRQTEGMTAAMTQSDGPTWVKQVNADGAFERRDAGFRDFVEGTEDARFPAEAGRYHLYVSYACPWAHRTLIARRLKGLEE